MTVRTDKIQALTGSAPLTLPTSLPTSSKSLQVSTTGVISAPNVATTLTNLTSSVNSNPGWVLLSHVEQDSGAETITVTNSSTTYPASDIYCYDIKYHLASDNENNSAANIRWSPMVSGVRKPNGNGVYGYGTRVLSSSGFNGTTNAPASGTSDAYNSYMGQIQYKRQYNNNPNNTSYSLNFDKSAASYGRPYAGDGGAQGTLRFYNGSGYQGCNINPEGNSSRIGTGNNYTNTQWSTCVSTMPVSNNPTHTDKVDGFAFWDSQSNSSRFIMGYVQLWGMPKTVS